ncbi:MAG: leucyl/phenylalanyl-tRNA--protein transferase [bacterium]|nr:leucyl/phenylalanyl-tRNA--protein transferase [bacterium]
MILEIRFPDPRHASDEGLVAVGGDFRPEFLLTAYANGIFPWPCEDIEYAWFSPNPRLVLVPEELRISRSLRKTLRKENFRIRFDTAFDEVIRRCAAAPRPGGSGSWITSGMISGYTALHRLGFAHSVESWRGGRLVGGLYGVSLGGMFCGESMFHFEPDASKVALVALVERLRRWRFRMIDCQVYTEHLARLGATEWPRDVFLDELEHTLSEPTRRGRWTEGAEGSNRL